MLGVACLLLAAVLWLAIDREGVLFSEALFTLRAPIGLEAARLTPRDTLAAGDFVAEFRPKIVELKQELEADRRHQQDLLERMTVEREEVLRDRTRTGLTKREQIAELEGRLGRLQMELEQARAQAELTRRDLAANEPLHERGLISDAEYDRRSNEAAIALAEVAKLDGLRACTRQQT